MSQPDSQSYNPKNDRNLVKVLPIMLLIGLGLLAGGIYFAVGQAKLMISGREAPGVVVELERGTSSSGGRPGFFPIVAFEPEPGREITFRHRTGGAETRYRIGDRVTVVYLPEAPEEALIAEGIMNALLPLLLLVIGPGMILLALRGIAGARARLRAG